MEATINMPSSTKSNALPMAIVAGLFFILGFATWLNGSLMPYLQQLFDLSAAKATLVLFSFYIAVTFAAIPSAMLISKVGYKNGMALGMGIMMLGGLCFIPAAQTQSFGVFLFAQLLMGSGITLLQTAVNPYVVRLGPEESAAVRISIMGILNKGAGVVAPIVFTALVLDGLTKVTGAPTQEQIDAMANALIMPYLGMGLFIGLLALAVKFSPIPDIKEEDKSEENKGQIKEALSHLNLRYGVIALTCYVAVEVIAADTIGSLAKAFGVESFAVMTSYTMGFMVAGYILGILAIPRVISQANALMVSAILGMVLTVLIVVTDPTSYTLSNIFLAPFGVEQLPNPVFLVALLGLANAIVWPAVFPLALSGLGKLTSAAAALLIMGIAGGAIGPLLWGGASNVFGGEQYGYSVMLPCYAFILFYALKGCKMKKEA